jgi:hypothetical protein
MLDIETLEDQATGEVAILHPVTGKPTGAWITLIGPEHPRRLELEFRQARRVRQRLVEGTGDAEDGETARAEWISHLAECTEGWRGIRQNGQEVPYSQAAAVDLYTRLGWLREQAGRAINRRELFIGGSANASSTGPASTTD